MPVRLRMLSGQMRRVSRVIGSCPSADCVLVAMESQRRVVAFETHFSQPSTAATPTNAALSSGLISFPFPGAVNVRKVDKIREAIGIAGCVADGKRGISSEVDMLLVNDMI